MYVVILFRINPINITYLQGKCLNTFLDFAHLDQRGKVGAFLTEYELRTKITLDTFLHISFYVIYYFFTKYLVQSLFQILQVSANLIPQICILSLKILITNSGNLIKFFSSKNLQICMQRVPFKIILESKVSCKNHIFIF